MSSNIADKFIRSDISDAEFRELALEIFHHQMEVCHPYRRYVELLGGNVERYEDIPFLPIELFKTNRIYGASYAPESTFTSSGTSGSETSHHYVASLELYRRSFLSGFSHFYGKVEDWSIFALLPSYLEREGSSLVYMVEGMHALNPSRGGFYLYDFEKLSRDLQKARENGEKILLIGVTFALVDFAEQYPQDLSGVTIMETGGMKGRKREISREELHRLLITAFNAQTVHSEYGMAEMLSQCYSSGGGIFFAPPWVKVSIRSLQNPLQKLATGNGGINIVDFANYHSCSFIATGDRGELFSDGSFAIHGRIFNEQLRGCNMLTE